MNDVQEFIVEVRSVEILEQYLRLAIPTSMDSLQEVAVKIMDRDDPHFNLSLPSSVYGEKVLPVLMVEGWFKQEANAKKHDYFNGYGPWLVFNSNEKNDVVDSVINHIKKTFEANKKTWEALFWKELGDGYNSDFNELDGSIGIGYKLQVGRAFPENLVISLVHMYHGK
jgi:hypothetical protein